MSQSEDIETIKTPVRAPKTNAHCERVIGTLRREVLDHILMLGEANARQVRARSQLPPEAHEQPSQAHASANRTVLRTRVLDGVINEYRYAA
ncbi:hypothetical protein ABZ746_06770 [Streptomyces sp. NPDC020096]